MGADSGICAGSFYLVCENVHFSFIELAGRLSYNNRMVSRYGHNLQLKQQNKTCIIYITCR